MADDLYSLLAKNFPDNDSFFPKLKEENNAYLIDGKDILNISNSWSDFIGEHVSQEFFDKVTEIIGPFMKDLVSKYKWITILSLLKRRKVPVMSE